MIVYILSSLVAPSALAEEATFDADLQYRPRFELRITDPEFDPIIKTTHRARAGFNWSKGDLKGRFSVQDVRTFGEESDTLKDYTGNGLDLHEGYLNWKTSDALVFKVGRQEIAMHGHRLIGSVNWAQQGRSFDGARASGSLGDFSYDLIGVTLANGSTDTWSATTTQTTTTTTDITASGTHFNQNTNTLEADAINSSLNILRLGWKSEGGSLVDVLAIQDTNSATEQNRITAGLYSKMSAGIISGRLESYIQMSNDSMANMVGTQATVAPEMGVKPTLTLWYDRLSSATDEGSAAFNTLFATNHKFYGHADIMAFSQGAMADGRGLQDISLKTSIKPGDSHTVKLDLHMFSATDGLEAAAYGNEVDLMTVSKLTDDLSFGWGGSYFMHADGETPANTWGWLQLDARL